MTVKKPKLVITLTNHNGSNQCNESIIILANACNLLKAREKLRVQGTIGFGFTFNWLKNLGETFKPITKRSNHNRLITFDSHLKTALCDVA